MDPQDKTEEHRQVAALLNLSIMMLAEASVSQRISPEDLRAWIADMEEDRIKITTDPEYRQWKFAANQMVFAMAAR